MPGPVLVHIACDLMRPHCLLRWSKRSHRWFQVKRQPKRRLDWESGKESASQPNVSTIKYASKVIFKAPSSVPKIRPVLASFVVPATASPTASTPKPIVNKVTKVTISQSPLTPQLPTEEAATPSKGKHRYETSLGQLTRKFISLLQNASDGVSDDSLPAGHLFVHRSHVLLLFARF